MRGRVPGSREVSKTWGMVSYWGPGVWQGTPRREFPQLHPLSSLYFQTNLATRGQGAHACVLAEKSTMEWRRENSSSGGVDEVTSPGDVPAKITAG